MTGASHSVWKYTLNEGNAITRLTMPKGARVLTAAWQGRDLCIWALVDPSEPRETRRFVVHVTGGQIEDVASLAYVGTVHSNDGGSPLVLHVFEVAQ